MTATLRLRTDELAKYRRLAGLKTDTALADRMSFDPGNLSRVLAGKQSPGPKFIAALVAAFSDANITLDDLFEVIDHDEPTA